MRSAIETLDAIKDSITSSVAEIGKVEHGNQTLEIKSIDFDDISKALPQDHAKQKEAKLNRKTFGLGIFANIVHSEDGKEHAQRIKIGNLPVPTVQGSYIVGGSPYNIDYQFRLKPGAYLRKKQNGEIETHINPIGFSNAKVTIDPKTLKLTFGIGQANVNALAFMNALGMSDSETRSLLGQEIYDANAKGLNPTREYQKLANRLSPFEPITVSKDELPKIQAMLKEQLEHAKLDPKVTKITLGKEYGNLGKDAIKAIVKKTIDGSRGLAEFDERDSLAFKHVHSVEDFVKDRLSGKATNQMARDLRDILHSGKPVGQMLSSKFLDDRVHSLFTQSSISEFAPRDNPLQAIGAFRKVTSTGEGGLENEHSITTEAQAVHPSHAFFLDPLDTPESKKAGIALKFAHTVKVENNEPKAEFLNAKTGVREYKSPIDLFHEHVLLPGPVFSDGTVAAIHHGKQTQVAKSKVTYEPIHTHHAFAETSLIAPALNYNQANRASMRARHAGQASSLIHREAPLVQSEVPNDKGNTYEKMVGGYSGAIRAPYDLEIVKRENDYIHFKTEKGEEGKISLMNHDPGTSKAFFHHEVDHITPGMKFKSGEVIADTNFTKDGHLALGKNLHVAYMPWHGLNFEDGIAISEEASHKLASQHLSAYDFDITRGSTMMSKRAYVAAFPGKLTLKQLARYEETGMPRKGVEIPPGDPLFLKIERSIPSKEDLVLGRVHKSLVKPYKDASEIWHGIVPAVVTDSVLQPTFGKVNVKYVQPAQIGDKLANRHGAKGVVSAIIPMDEVPHTKDGEAIDVLLSPLSIITRMSMGQVIETAASKIAKKTGKPYLIESFSDVDYVDKVKADLAKHGLSDTTELVDPKTGHSYGKVLTGYPVMQKLFKLAHGNLSARELGTYDIDHKPMTGGDEGAKAIDQLTLYGLLAHGHRAILNEVSTIKGDYNPDYWQKLQLGLPLPKPQIPFAYRKFESLLAASGINVRQDGNLKILSPMTDKDTHALAGENTVQNFKMLDHSFEPIRGGLFDIQMTGGSNGSKWSKFHLAKPVPNPLFESAIKSVLEIDDKQFKGILNHTHHVDGRTGHEAFEHMLGKIDVNSEMDAVTSRIENATQSKKDKLIKKRKLLKALNHLNLTAKDAYMMSTVPIIPPMYRPIVEMPNGSVNPAPLNILYRDAGLINETAKQFGTDGETYSTLYKSVGAIQGVNEPVSPQAKGKGIKGAVELITGSTPKLGYFQSKVVRKQQDVSARATIAMDNNLNMDEISIPREIAQSLYKPFAIRTLVNAGHSVVDARKHIEDWSSTGKKAIDHEMSQRPIMMNRAPSLHRYSIMSFKPKINDSESVLIPGLIVKPFGADFDGDTVMLHVPVSEKARVESLKMLPSQNLYDARTLDLNYTPAQESVLGLHLMSKTHDGRKFIQDLLPASSQRIEKTLHGKDVTKLLEEVAKKHPEQYNKVATGLKEAGDKFATMAGFSVSLNDMKPTNPGVVKAAFGRANAAKGSKLDAMQEADRFIGAQALNDSENNLVQIVSSGAKGKADNIKQILYAPGVMLDHNGKRIDRPVLSNYGSGANFADYWTATYGARKGTLDKQMQTAKPGALNKEIVNSAMNLVISTPDCGTQHGLSISLNDPHVIGRFDVTGEQITKSHLEQLRKDGHSSIVVRSPQTCEAIHGVCRKCFGHTEFGTLAPVGHNVGIISAQAMSEPLTQAAMKTFHMGGTASGGGGVFGGFEVISNFLQAPQTFKNKAVLSTKSGTISDIKPGAAGGWHIKIDGADHFVHPDSGELLVKHGDKVTKGSMLNHGIPHPVEAIDLLGHKEGGQLIVDTLHNLYKSSDISIDRKNIETVVRGLTGFAKISDGGSHPTLTIGDVIGIDKVREFNAGASKPIMVHPHKAYGMILSKPVSGIAAGTKLNAEHLHKLKHHDEIEASHVPIEYDRTYIGSSQAPTRTGDWLGNLSFRYLKRGLENGAMHASQSDVHGYHPIAPFVTGELQESNHTGRY